MAPTKRRRHTIATTSDAAIANMKRKRRRSRDSKRTGAGARPKVSARDGKAKNKRRAREKSSKPHRSLLAFLIFCKGEYDSESKSGRSLPAIPPAIEFWMDTLLKAAAEILEEFWQDADLKPALEILEECLMDDQLLQKRGFMSDVFSGTEYQPDLLLKPIFDFLQDYRKGEKFKPLIQLAQIFGLGAQVQLLLKATADFYTQIMPVLKEAEEGLKRLKPAVELFGQSVRKWRVMTPAERKPFEIRADAAFNSCV